MAMNVVGGAVSDPIASPSDQGGLLKTELRVHGVSGTPPSRILHTDPVTYDQGWDLAKVYEQSRDRWQVKAYHWGSLTSKSSLSAFWILLAPFAMANVAGWMSESQNIWSRIWTRIAGLALSGIFFAQLANVALDIPYSAGTGQVAVTWMFATLSLTLTVGLGLLSTQSTFRPMSPGERLRHLLAPSIHALNPALRTPRWDDPTGGANLVGPDMWGVHSIVHRLRRIHLTFGMAILALVAARATGFETLELSAVLTAGVLMVTLALTAGATASNRVVLTLTALCPLAGISLIAWAVVALTTGDLGAGTLTVSDEITFEIALILGIAAGLGLVGELVATGVKHGWVPLGLLAIATLVGGTLGLTAAMLADSFFSRSASTVNAFDGGAAFVTVGMLGLVLVMLATFLISAAAGNRTSALLRNGVLRARVVLTVAAIYASAVGLIAVVSSCQGPHAGCSQSNITVPSWVAESPGDTVVILGLAVDPSSVLGWSKLAMVAVPAILILRSIVGGLLNGQDSRRRVGILWDLGSFWPRWFHPLGPPAYGPYAVNRLQTMITDQEPDVLAAHSQGSLIAAIALSLVEGDTRPGLFITYGSQVGRLYPDLFRGIGFDDLIVATDRQMKEDWINLWRASDSLGGQPIPQLGNRNWEVTTGQGHSDYELTPEFCAARKAVTGTGRQKPPASALDTCWDDP